MPIPAWLSGYDPRPFMATLLEAFGARFVAYLLLIYGFIKGVVYQAQIAVMLPFFKNHLHVSAVDYQKYYNVAVMAFAIKPLLGALSDAVPIAGYHKRPYLVALFFLGSGSLLGSAFLPPSPSSGAAAAALFFLCMLAVAGADLMCEGKYSEIMIEKKETGSTVVTWVWLCVMSGSVIAAAMEGPLADEADPKLVLFILAPLLLMPVVPTLLGWLPERRVDAAGAASEAISGGGSEMSDMDVHIIGRLPTSTQASSSRVLVSPAAMKHKGIALLSVATSCVALGMVVLSLLAKEQYPILIYVGVTVLALQIVSFNVLPRAAAAANLFMFCKELFYVQINGALDYYYTATPQCLNSGPHFSFTYYQTFGNIAAAVAGVLGVALFQRFLSARKFRIVFWFTTALKVVAALFDLMIILRWNASIGIPDKAAYIFGDAIVGQVAMMLDFMPVAVLMSKLCPKGMEATMYALLAGFSNFGQVSSRAIGGMITEAFEIRAVSPCNFEHMWELVLVCHMVLPLAVIPLSVVLIPNKTMHQSILTRAEGGESDDDDGAHLGRQDAESAESSLDDDDDSRSSCGRSAHVQYRSKPSSAIFASTTPLDEGLIPQDHHNADEM